LVFFWAFAVLLIVALASDGGPAPADAVSIVLIVAAAFVITYWLRIEAIVVEGTRIGHRNGFRRRVTGWTDVFDVVDIDVGLRRHFPHGFTGLTLWSAQGGKRYRGREWHLVPASRSKWVEYHEAGLRPLIIPVVDLGARDRVRLRAFLEAGGITFPADAEGRTVWSSSFV
jgi:hypothetical protein